MIKAIRHTGIVVSDLDKSLHFYRDLLGFEIVKDKLESGNYIDSVLSLKNASVRTIKMKAPDGNLIELLYFKSHPKKPENTYITGLGCSHIAFTVDNVEKEYKRLLGEGIKFNSSPEASPDGYAKVVFCRDPKGAWIELVEVLNE